MAAPLKALFDRRQLALTKAKLRAWWEGEEFDEAAALSDLDEAGGPANDSAPVDDDLFDAPAIPVPPRIAALMKVWGEDRIRPGDAAAEALEAARLGAPETGCVAVSGAGLCAPLLAFADAFPGQIDAFEWRDESFALLQAGIAKAKLDQRVTVTRIDLEAHVWKPEHYDGFWSVDDFAYVGFPPHLAQQIMKLLKPGACAVVECYAGVKAPDYATAFASSFAEPQIRPHGDLVQVFADVGLTLEADEDLTDEFIDLAKRGFKRLAEALANTDGLDVAQARELAWEAEAWRMRLRLLAQRRLERRRFTLRKPAEDQPPPPEAAPQMENANAPEG